jgi:ABC-2 type transport system ATP-binding protein
MENMVKVENLQKDYFRVKAVNKLSFEVEKGKILGLLGPNGSGKSTTLKIMAGLIKPTSGEVYIDNMNPSYDTKKIVAFLPEIDHLYKWMTIRELLDFIAPFFEDWNLDKEKNLVKFLNLDENALIKSLSKGQKAKVKLITVLARDSKLLLMDEPLSGIDYPTRDKILEAIVKNYREKEQTIIISTHEIPQSEGIFDEVIFLDEGNVALSGKADELRDKYGKSITEIMKEVYPA